MPLAHTSLILKYDILAGLGIISEQLLGIY